MSSTSTREEGTKATLRCPFCQRWNRVDIARAANRPRCGECGRPLLLDRPMTLDDESFDRTIAGSQVPVLVDFHADWCGPCKVMAPVVDQLAAAHEGSLLVGKVDTDRSPATARRFNITGIPTVIVFRGGVEVRRQSGAMPLGALEALLK